MAIHSMAGIVAIMPAADMVITMPSGGSMTWPGGVPFACTAGVDLPDGAVVAVMRGFRGSGSVKAQVFHVDDIVTTPIPGATGGSTGADPKPDCEPKPKPRRKRRPQAKAA